MSYSIALILNLKNPNMFQLENLIYDACKDCNVTNIYNDYELEGINKYIKKNTKIIISEFENIENICYFIKFIKILKTIKIEYIYDNNNILYATEKYLNAIDNNLYDKKKLIKIIENNKENIKYKSIYKSLIS
jgi:hypothetical protein